MRIVGAGKSWNTRDCLACGTGLLAVLLMPGAPLMPGVGFDHGWVLAAEHAARVGAVFGRDFVLTVGPYAFLYTHLFDAATFGWALLCDIGLTSLWLMPLLIQRGASVLFAYAVALLFAPATLDALVPAALLALGAVAANRPGRWTVLVAFAFAPVCLAKFSFIPVALPVFLFLDIHAVMARRPPLHGLVHIGSMAGFFWATGHPPHTWPLAVSMNWQVISGYSRAMQLPLGTGGLLALAAILVGLAGLLGWLWLVLRSRPAGRGELLVGAVTLWCCFMAFKMGYVRPDGHMLTTWHMLLLAVPPLSAFGGRSRSLTWKEQSGAAFISIFAGATLLFFGQHFASPPMTPAAYLAGRVQMLALQPFRTLAWLLPSRWREASAERAAADKRLHHDFPAAVQGRIDAVPERLSELIVSEHGYAPRPVPQGGTSYTARLQRADAEYFANPTTAPDTVLFTMGSETDLHLPTLDIGPTLPVLARWYDLAGIDAYYGLILRRRAVPRPLRPDVDIRRDFGIGEWVSIPAGSPAAMTIAAITMERSPILAPLNLMFREPVLFIELRSRDGRGQRFRFVPGMVEAGTVISPMMVDAQFQNLPGVAGTLFPGSHPRAAVPIEAFRIVGGELARMGFTGGRVRLTTVRVDQ